MGRLSPEAAAVAAAAAATLIHGGSRAAAAARASAGPAGPKLGEALAAMAGLTAVNLG